MSDTKDTNPKDAAATTRLDLSLFPPSAVAYGALAFTEGDLKYGGYNWRTAGIQVTVYIAALLRHVFKYVSGEWADPKTGVPHLASALACIAALIDGHEMGNLNDDRPPRQDMAGLLDRMEGMVAHLQKIFPRRHARHRALMRREDVYPSGDVEAIRLGDIVLKQEPETVGPLRVEGPTEVRPFAGRLETTPDVGRVPVEVRDLVAEQDIEKYQRWDRPPVEEPGDDAGNQKSADEIARENLGRITASEIRARSALRGRGGV